MSRDESYDPHGETKVLSPWASAAKDGKKNLLGKAEVTEREKKGTLKVKDIEKRKPSAAEVNAAKAAHRQAERQLVADLIDHSLVGNNAPQLSNLTADLCAAQKTSIVASAILEHSYPCTELPTRSETAAHGKGVAKTDTKGPSAAKDLKWT